MTTTDTTLPRLILAILDGTGPAEALADYLLERGGHWLVRGRWNQGIVRGIPELDALLRQAVRWPTRGETLLASLRYQFLEEALFEDKKNGMTQYLDNLRTICLSLINPEERP